MSVAELEPTTLLAELADASPTERVARIRSHGDPDELLVELGDEAEKLTAIEVARALRSAELVVQLADAVGGARPRVRARRALAQALSYAGRFQEALEQCAAATDIGHAAGEEIETSRVRLASIHALSELGRYDDAVAAGEQAWATFQRHGREDLGARADINLGGVHQNRDDPERALFHLDRARRTLADDTSLLPFFVENNSGEAYVRLHRFAEAEQAYRAALERAVAADAPFAIALASGNLGELDGLRGYLDRALHHLEHARNVLANDVANSHVARLTIEQAEVFEAIGQHERALRLCEDALPRLAAEGLRAEQARAELTVARCRWRLARHDESVAAFTASARIYRELDQDLEYARVQLTLAEACAAIEDWDRVAATLPDNDALDARPIDRARRLLLEARLRLHRGDPAERQLAAAEAALTQAPTPALLSHLWHVRGTAAWRAGDADAATDALVRAIDYVDSVRNPLQSAGMRTAYQAQHGHLYDDAVRASLGSGRDAARRAFQISERSRGRTLLDQLGGWLDAAPASDNDTALEGELSALYAELAEAGSHVARGELLQEIRQREGQLAERADRSAASTSGLRSAARTITAAEACQQVDDATALVSYFRAGRQWLAFVVRPGDVAVVDLQIDDAQLADAVRRLRFQINRGLLPRRGGDTDTLLRAVRAPLQRLHDGLLAPLESHLADRRRLLIVPHGALHAVPFHALWDGAAYLIDRFELATVPSVSLLAALRQRPAGPAAAPLVAGFADHNAPLIEQELISVAAQLAAPPPLRGAATTWQRFREQSAATGLIHLATHGRFDPYVPQASALRFADRWTPVRELARLRLQADLLVLSGCDTGRSFVQRGDELLGISQGFLAAGATSLLVSHWRLNDRRAGDMMLDFYRTWNRDPATGARAAALRTVQRRWAAADPHPARWATLFLVGLP